MSSLFKFNHIFDEEHDNSNSITVEWCNALKNGEINDQMAVDCTEDVIKRMMNNPDLDHHYMSTGNLFVIGFRNEEGNIEIEVTKRYKTAFVQTE